MVETVNAFGMPKRSWMEQLKWRLFPQSCPDSIETPWTYLVTEVHIGVDWVDRLRLLVSGKAIVRLRTYTDVRVEQVQSSTSFEVVPPGVEF